MDMTHPAAEIDHGQAVAEVSAVSAEAHQLAGLNFVVYAQLGDAAAAAGDLESPSGSGQGQSPAPAHSGGDDIDIAGNQDVFALLVAIGGAWNAPYRALRILRQITNSGWRDDAAPGSANSRVLQIKNGTYVYLQADA